MFQALIQRAGVALLVLVASTLLHRLRSARKLLQDRLQAALLTAAACQCRARRSRSSLRTSRGLRTAVTSENGDYLLPALPPGPYTITVELSGFATSKQTRDVGTGAAGRASTSRFGRHR